jgi:hypothetical protein
MTEEKIIYVGPIRNGGNIVDAIVKSDGETTETVQIVQDPPGASTPAQPTCVKPNQFGAATGLDKVWQAPTPPSQD